MKLGEFELNKIYTGDARELSKGIPDESVDLIFTDPVYENLEDYRWLADTASRILKPNSACLCFCPNMKIKAVIEAMSSLQYAKTLCYNLIKMVRGIVVNPRDYKCQMAWTPCLWFEKGTTQANGRMFDLIIDQWGPSKNFHKWGKSLKVAEWIAPLSSIGSIVLDPFSGGGSTLAASKNLQRNFVGFEIDPKTAEQARGRLGEMQDPLPLVKFKPVQEVLFNSKVGTLANKVLESDTTQF